MNDKYDDVLIPTDGSAGTGRVLDHAIELASTTGATLHATSVVELETPLSDFVTDSYREELEKQAERATQRVLDRATETDIEATATVTEGIPHETILQYVDENGIDLIVMGTHGRSGVDRALLGSVAERVVRFSPVPVVTVPLPEDGRAVAHETDAAAAARRAIDGEGYEIDEVADVYRETGSWIVQATTDSGIRLNVHIDASTGDTRIAELDPE